MCWKKTRQLDRILDCAWPSNLNTKTLRGIYQKRSFENERQTFIVRATSHLIFNARIYLIFAAKVGGQTPLKHLNS